MNARTVPPKVRRFLVGGAVLLILIAAAVNIAHTRQNATDNGQDQLSSLVIGFLPDIGLVLSVVRLRYFRRCPWAWTGIAASVAMVAWSSLAVTDGHGLGGKIMALVCLAWAIVYTGQAHVPAGEPAELVLAHVEALAEDATRAAELAVALERETANLAVLDSAEALAAARVELDAERAGRLAEVADLTAKLETTRASREPADNRPANRPKPQVIPLRPAERGGWRTADHVMQALLMSADPMTTGDLTKATALAKSTVKTAVAQLAADGLIVDVSAGTGWPKYRLTEQSAAVQAVAQ